MVKTTTLAIILAALIISVVFMNEADGAGLVWRAVNKSGSSIHDIANVTRAGCAVNQYLSVNSTAFWTCTTISSIDTTKVSSSPQTTATIITDNSTSGVTLKTLEQGTGITITNGSQKVTIASSITQGFTNITPISTSTDSSLLVSNSSSSGVFKNLKAGTGISLTNNTQDVTITSSITQGFTNIYPITTSSNSTLIVSNSTNTTVLKNIAGTSPIVVDNGSNTVIVSCPTCVDNAYPISTSTNATLIVSNSTNDLILKNIGAGAGITIYNGSNTVQINMTVPINVLSVNATITTDNGDALVFDIPLTANSGNGISGLLIANSFTTGSAVRAGMNVTNLNTRGTCLVSSTLTSITTSLDNLVMNTVLTGRSTNSSDTVWLLANNTNPITFDCALISGSPAGNLRVWITAEENPGTGKAVQALAGSYFFHTP